MSRQIKPIRHGVVLVAGGAIGAGMFALPLVAAQAWTLWAFIALSLVGLVTALAADLLLKVRGQFDLGASFHTLVFNSFGSIAAWLNNLSIAFIMLILMYAYVTAGGRILAASFNLEQAASLKLVFASIVALLVWFGALVVSRLSILLIAIMAVSFLFVIGTLAPYMSTPGLGHTQLLQDANNTWLLMPVFVTAFACGGIVPTIVDYYAGQPSRARKSIWIGISLTFLIYAIWLLICFSVLGKQMLTGLNAEQAGMAELLAALKAVSEKEQLLAVLTGFSHLAVITSFLSVALGLVHFIQDRLSLSTNLKGRGLATLIAFSPPMIASLVAPYGFVQAISYAGFFVAISFFIVPACLYIKHDKLNFAAITVLLAGVLVILFKALS